TTPETPVTPVVVTPPVIVIPPVIITPPVITPPTSENASCVVFSASATEINPGDAVTLTWVTANATGISIDQGIGPVTPVASGSTAVHRTADTTYVATVTGTSTSVHCQASVHIHTQPPVASCVSLTATPNAINPGDAVTLAWQTANATSITIDNGVGSVTPVD